MEVPSVALNDGLKIPCIGLGTWRLWKQECVRAIKMALEVGYRHIDTAYIYDNQEAIKEGIKGFDREELFLTSKLWLDHIEPDKVERGCDECLSSLGVDYIDLFIMHWPDKKKLVQTLKVMHKLKEKGKIKSVGVSNCTIHHLQDLLDAGIDISINQVEFHPYLNQKKLLDFCKQHNIVITAYSPIARGKVCKDKQILAIGKKYNKTASQISLRWLFQKGIVVIPKGSSYSHIQENFDIFDFMLDQQDVKIMDLISSKNEERQIVPKFQEFDY